MPLFHLALLCPHFVLLSCLVTINPPPLQPHCSLIWFSGGQGCVPQLCSLKWEEGHLEEKCIMNYRNAPLLIFLVILSIST